MTIEKPVGTGPFEVESYNGRRLTLARRDDYWQADKIKVEKIVQEGIFDSSQAALKLETGEFDAYYGEIPNPQKTFVEADPESNHFYYAPDGMNVLTGNLTEAPLSDQKFREAISYAMDKEAISQEGHVRDRWRRPASPASSSPPMENLLPEDFSGVDTVLPFDLDKANRAARRCRLRRREQTASAPSPTDAHWPLPSPCKPAGSITWPWPT